jgi:hypothetical protein
MAPDAARRASAALGPQSLSSLRQPVTAAGFRGIPSTYITGARDAGIPPALSAMFSWRADKELVLDTAHSAFYARPVELASLLRGELGDA